MTNNLILTDEPPKMDDFVYNATADTIDRVVPFNLVAGRLTKLKQCTLDAARDHGHKVIDISKLKSKDMGKFMKHNSYSDTVILEEVEEGEYEKLGQAFQNAAQRLGCRKDQVAARYYNLKSKGITLADVFFTEEDRESFDPGDPEKIQRVYGTKERGKSPEGYWKKEQEEQDEIASDDTVVEINTPSDEIMAEIDRNLNLAHHIQEGEQHIIERTIVQLLEGTDPTFKLKIVKLIMKDL